jgi:hypothetical protein
MSLERALADVTTNGAPEPNPEFTPPPVEQAPASALISGLRARYAQVQAEQTTDMAIPGWGDMLWARYHAISVASLFINRSGVPRNMGDWRLAADALATALDGLYGRNERGELEPLQYDAPTRFDDELVNMLGLNVTEHTARAVMVAVFGGGERGESRIWVQFNQYSQWLGTGADEEAVSDALGEHTS